MHILDDAVTEILHQIFDRMTAMDDNTIIRGSYDKHLEELRANIKRVKAENTKVNTEY